MGENMDAIKAPSAGKRNRLKSNSPWLEMWHRLKSRPLAVVAMSGVAIILLVAIFADVIYPYEMAIKQVSGEKLLSPGTPGHILGTDNLGRDMAARIIHGTRTAMLIGILSSFLSMTLASVAACACAMFGERVDNIIMRIRDVLACIPQMVIALSICASLGNGIPQLMLALTISSFPHQIGMVRSYSLRVAKMEYIESAVALGGTPWYIIRKHMLPNIANIIIINASAQISHGIMMGATLGFIGLGIKAPTPEWGTMLSTGLNYLLRNQYMVYIPGIVLAVTALFMNTLGDCLRDAFDPQLKGKS